MTEFIKIDPSVGCRQNLQVRTTSIVFPKRGKSRSAERGLFTTEPIPKGGFIGLYAGDFEDAEDNKAITEYTVSNGFFDITPSCGEETCRKGVDPRPDAGMFPLAMVNEPPSGVTANCVMVDWTEPIKVVYPLTKELKKYYTTRGGPRWTVHCIAYHAARHINAGEEIFVHYGNSYGRKYTVGKPAFLYKNDWDDIEFGEIPRIYFEEHRIDIPENTYVLTQEF